MGGVAGPHARPDGADAGRAMRVWQLASQAWSSLDRRQWLAALAVGIVLGCVQGLHVAATLWDEWPQLKAGLTLTITLRWVVALTLVAGVQLFGLALLHPRGRDGKIRPRHYLALLLGVVLFHALIAAPIAYLLNRVLHEAMALPRPGFWADHQGLALLLAIWSRSGPVVIILSSLTLLLHAYVLEARRSARALATAQLQLAEARRRALAEELQQAQAMVDPDFLFATLQQVAQCYEAEPAQAQRLLDALIRYLRAALPELEGAACTVGRQADLVRAYLDIETVRSQGLLQAGVDVVAQVRSLPIAPLLVLPLVADAVRRGAALQRPYAVGLRAWPEPERLVLEIDGPDGPDTPALAEVQRRLEHLHGRRARLPCTRQDGRTRVLRLEIDLAEGS